MRLTDVALTVLCLCVGSTSALPRILLFTKTSPGAYRHDSIPTAVDIITRIGTGNLVLDDSVADASVTGSSAKWESVHSEDDGLWTSDGSYLSQFDAIAFISTSDTDPPNSTTLLSNESEASLIRYIQAGGNYVGVHSASATLYTFPPYGRLVGAFFDYHPEIQEVGIRALTNDNPSTSKFPNVLTIDEEVYHFRTDPRLMPSAPTVLLSNATAFSDPQAASRTRSDGPAPRPLAWVRQGDLLNAPSEPLGQGMDDPSGGTTYSGGNGRMFYTSLGHANETWMQPAFQAHVAGGIAWVLASSTTRANNDSALIGQTSNSTGDSTKSNATGASNFAPEGRISLKWFSMLLATLTIASASLLIN